MATFNVTLSGIPGVPMLMHQDDVDHSDTMKAWETNPANRNESKAGDDRTPGWRWLGYLYHDGKVVVVPTLNLMACLRKAGAAFKGKGRSSLKSASTTSMAFLDGASIPLLVGGRSIDVVKLAEASKAAVDFTAQKQVAERFGFAIDVRRASVGSGKHVRTRPAFTGWTLDFRLEVESKEIESVLPDLLTYAGRFVGLGDWRPGASTPGPFGRFSAEVTRAK